MSNGETLMNTFVAVRVGLRFVCIWVIIGVCECRFLKIPPRRVGAFNAINTFISSWSTRGEIRCVIYDYMRARTTEHMTVS